MSSFGFNYNTSGVKAHFFLPTFCGTKIILFLIFLLELMLIMSFPKERIKATKYWSLKIYLPSPFVSFPLFK